MDSDGDVTKERERGLRERERDLIERERERPQRENEGPHIERESLALMRPLSLSLPPSLPRCPRYPYSSGGVVEGWGPYMHLLPIIVLYKLYTFFLLLLDCQ
jgi:hypothetical protein